MNPTFGYTVPRRAAIHSLKSWALEDTGWRVIGRCPHGSLGHESPKCQVWVKKCHPSVEPVSTGEASGGPGFITRTCWSLHCILFLSHWALKRSEFWSRCSNESVEHGANAREGSRVVPTATLKTSCAQGPGRRSVMTHLFAHTGLWIPSPAPQTEQNRTHCYGPAEPLN